MNHRRDMEDHYASLRDDMHGDGLTREDATDRCAMLYGRTVAEDVAAEVEWQHEQERREMRGYGRVS